MSLPFRVLRSLDVQLEWPWCPSCGRSGQWQVCVTHHCWSLSLTESVWRCVNWSGSYYSKQLKPPTGGYIQENHKWIMDMGCLLENATCAIASAGPSLWPQFELWYACVLWCELQVNLVLSPWKSCVQPWSVAIASLMLLRVDGKIAWVFCHFAFAYAVFRVDSTLLPAAMLLSLNFQVKQCLTGTGQQMMRQCVAKLSWRICFSFSVWQALLMLCAHLSTEVLIARRERA